MVEPACSAARACADRRRGARAAGAAEHRLVGLGRGWVVARSPMRCPGGEPTRGYGFGQVHVKRFPDAEVRRATRQPDFQSGARREAVRGSGSGSGAAVAEVGTLGSAGA